MSQIFLPGDPQHTHFIKDLQTISALIGNKVPQDIRIYLTSTQWAQVAAEIRVQYQGELANPVNLPTKDNFKRLRIGKLLVINAETEDLGLVHSLNAPWAEACDFANRRDRLKSGYKI